MTNEQLRDYAVRQKRLVDIIGETSDQVQILHMENHVKSLERLQKKISSETFKIMVMGNFKNGKSTFINAFLGEEILPAYAVPTTAIINEIKYGDTPRAVLHFMDPLPEKMYEGIPEPAMEHMQKYNMEHVPPIEMPVDEIEDYVVIPLGMEHKEALRQSPFEKVELFWPLDLLKDGVEIVDSPGLNENPVRTQVTLEYLSKADAILFVFSALAMGSAGEIAYIEDTLRQCGFGKESLFCVVNRFDQLSSEREQVRLRKFSDRLLEPYTNHVYYTSAFKGLQAQQQHDMNLLEESCIPQVETGLTKYLAYERGRSKLAAPARELVGLIQQDVLEGTIPEKRQVLSTDLDVLRKRYEEAQPDIEKLQQKKEVITSRTQAWIASMEPEVRRTATRFFTEFPTLIQAWGQEYEPQTTIGLLHPRRDAEKMAEEISNYLQNQVDSEVRQWLSGPFTKFINDKVDELKEAMEGRLQDFFVSLDQVRLHITGSGQLPEEEMAVWKRVVAAGGGILVGDIGVAALGATTGLTSEFAKGIALQVGAYVALALLGCLNPVTIVAVMAASVIRGGIKMTEGTAQKVKGQVAASFSEEVENRNLDLVDTVAQGAMENFQKIQDVIAHSMDVEIEEMQKQMEELMQEMEKGKEAIEKQEQLLDTCEQDLKNTVGELKSYLGEILT